MNHVFSLIIATYGRFDSLDRLLKSIQQQSYNLSFVEVCIVDQNDQIDISYLIKKYQQYFMIEYIQSNIKGLSYNRNLALKKMNGDIIAFPDDDCYYYSNTLSTVNEIYSQEADLDCALGKIYNRELKKNIIRNWKNNKIKIKYSNFYFNYSSITIFTKRNNANFDEKLGVGNKFGSYEDADYIVELLDQNKNIVYFPTIHVWHPELDVSVMDEEKIYSYGLGFGALCKKRLNFFIGILFLGSIIFHMIMLILAILRFDIKSIKKRYYSILSKIKGFILWES